VRLLWRWFGSGTFPLMREEALSPSRFGHSPTAGLTPTSLPFRVRRRRNSYWREPRPPVIRLTGALPFLAWVTSNSHLPTWFVGHRPSFP